MIEAPVKHAPRPTVRWRVNSPFFGATQRHGCLGYSSASFGQCGVFLFPAGFRDPEEEYWALVEKAVMWEVPDERPIEIRGPDAEALMELLVTCKISGCAPGSSRYVLLTDHHGGLINDTIAFRLSPTRFWLAADFGWIKGVAAGSKLNVEVEPAAAFPVQVQGPKSPAVIARLFGDALAGLKRFQFKVVTFRGVPLLISRTGWSGELGYEVYVCSFDRAGEIWDAILEAGAPEGLIATGSANARRVEAGFLSSNADYTMYETPFDVGLEAFVDLEKPQDFIGKTALKALAAAGAQRRWGRVVSAEPIKETMAENTWPVLVDGKEVGIATTLVWSPRLKKNIGFVLFNSPELSRIDEMTVMSPERGMTFFQTPKSFEQLIAETQSRG